ncbi:sodium-dependent glucose transporter 1-like [Haliotis asinina]|uniref:sodium-dependent glucose transporter 1-like n=1 Tax=Haliotis asinina TaxID=109174 RepID=UPI003531F54F
MDSGLQIPDRNRYFQTALLFLVSFVQGANNCIIGITLPDLLCLLHVDLQTASSIFMCYGAGMCLSTAVGFLIRDRVDASLLMASILVTNSLALALLPNSNCLTVFACFYFINGWCTGMLYFGRLVQNEILWPAHTFCLYLMATGSSLPPIILPLLASPFLHVRRPELHQHINMTAVYDQHAACENFSTDIEYVFLGLSVVGIVVSACLLANHYNLLSKGYMIKAAEPVVPAKIEVRVTVKRTMTCSVFSVLVILSSFTVTACLSTYLSLLVTFGIRSRLRLDVDAISFLMSTFSLGVFLGRLSNMLLSHRVRPTASMSLNLVLCLAASSFLLAYRDTSSWVVWISTAVIAFGNGPLLPGFLAWTKQHMNLSPNVLNAIMLPNYAGCRLSLGELDLSVVPEEHTQGLDAQVGTLLITC